jgi:hypothetical protein
MIEPMLRDASPFALLVSVVVFAACSHEAPLPVESPTAVPESTAGAPSEPAPVAPAEASPEPSAPSAPEPAPPRPAGKRAPCTLGQDQTCNGDPSVSALWGKCLPSGTCECKPGFELAPAGYCQPVK